MAETVGSLVDKISIMNLKLWHLEDEARRTDVDDSRIAAVKRKIDVANLQRNDLIEELDALLADFLSGEKKPKVYKQLKMYGKPGTSPEQIKQAIIDTEPQGKAP
jgi:hypothetical protein